MKFQPSLKNYNRILLQFEMSLVYFNNNNILAETDLKISQKNVEMKFH